MRSAVPFVHDQNGNVLYHQSMPKKSTRAWISGLAVTLTTIVSYLAFWRLAPGTTFIIGCVALLGAVVAAWIYGGEEFTSRRSEEKSPRRRNDRHV
jgi:hypothetical protein